MECGPVNTIRDVFEDLQLQSRGYWTEGANPEMNRNITYPGAPYQFDETRWQVRRCAPSIGQDNTDVLKGELGMPEKKLAVLAEMGII